MSEFPKTIRVQVAFDIGETVYIGTDSEQSKHQVLGYSVRSGTVLYELYSHNSGEYIAYEFELSRDKDLT